MINKTSETSMGHIMIVDDEAHVTDLLKYNLESEHYGVTVKDTAAEVPSLDLSDVRLILADAMNQKFNGLSMLAALKANALTEHIPVIIVSHSDTEDDILAAFNAGADDYILKPFSLRELVARIRSVLRRHPITQKEKPQGANLEFGQLTIDLISRQARIAGELVPLTKTEFAILSLLAKNNGEFFTRRQIYDHVWRDVDRGDNDRIVDTNISRLRKKLGSLNDMLQNKTGYGYNFVPK